MHLSKQVQPFWVIQDTPRAFPEEVQQPTSDLVVGVLLRCQFQDIPKPQVSCRWIQDLVLIFPHCPGDLMAAAAH
jgi:hypothetical protein